MKRSKSQNADPLTQLQDGQRRVVIEGVKPEIDAGRCPITRAGL